MFFYEDWEVIFRTKHGFLMLGKQAKSYDLAWFLNFIVQLYGERMTLVMTSHACAIAWHISHSMLLASYYVENSELIWSHIILKIWSTPFFQEMKHPCWKGWIDMIFAKFVNSISQLSSVFNTSVSTENACVLIDSWIGVWYFRTTMLKISKLIWFHIILKKWSTHFSYRTWIAQFF